MTRRCPGARAIHRQLLSNVYIYVSENFIDTDHTIPYHTMEFAQKYPNRDDAKIPQSSSDKDVIKHVLKHGFHDISIKKGDSELSTKCKRFALMQACLGIEVVIIPRDTPFSKQKHAIVGAYVMENNIKENIMQYKSYSLMVIDTRTNEEVKISGVVMPLYDDIHRIPFSPCNFNVKDNLQSLGVVPISVHVFYEHPNLLQYRLDELTDKEKNPDNYTRTRLFLDLPGDEREALWQWLLPREGIKDPQEIIKKLKATYTGYQLFSKHNDNRQNLVRTLRRIYPSTDLVVTRPNDPDPHLKIRLEKAVEDTCNKYRSKFPRDFVYILKRLSAGINFDDKTLERNIARVERILKKGYLPMDKDERALYKQITNLVKSTGKQVFYIKPQGIKIYFGIAPRGNISEDDISEINGLPVQPYVRFLNDQRLRLWNLAGDKDDDARFGYLYNETTGIFDVYSIKDTGQKRQRKKIFNVVLIPDIASAAKRENAIKPLTRYENEMLRDLGLTEEASGYSVNSSVGGTPVRNLRLSVEQDEEVASMDSENFDTTMEKNTESRRESTTLSRSSRLSTASTNSSMVSVRTPSTVSKTPGRVQAEPMKRRDAEIIGVQSTENKKARIEADDDDDDDDTSDSNGYRIAKKMYKSQHGRHHKRVEKSDSSDNWLEHVFEDHTYPPSEMVIHRSQIVDTERPLTKELMVSPAQKNNLPANITEATTKLHGTIERKFAKTELEQAFKVLHSSSESTQKDLEEKDVAQQLIGVLKTQSWESVLSYLCTLDKTLCKKYLGQNKDLERAMKDKGADEISAKCIGALSYGALIPIIGYKARFLDTGCCLMLFRLDKNPTVAGVYDVSMVQCFSIVETHHNIVSAIDKKHHKDIFIYLSDKKKDIEPIFLDVLKGEDEEQLLLYGARDMEAKIKITYAVEKKQGMFARLASALSIPERNTQIAETIFLVSDSASGLTKLQDAVNEAPEHPFKKFRAAKHGFGSPLSVTWITGITAIGKALETHISTHMRTEKKAHPFTTITKTLLLTDASISTSLLAKVFDKEKSLYNKWLAFILLACSCDNKRKRSPRSNTEILDYAKDYLGIEDIYQYAKNRFFLTYVEADSSKYHIYLCATAKTTDGKAEIIVLAIGKANPANFLFKDTEMLLKEEFEEQKDHLEHRLLSSIKIEHMERIFLSEITEPIDPSEDSFIARIAVPTFEILELRQNRFDATRHGGYKTKHLDDIIIGTTCANYVDITAVIGEQMGRSIFQFISEDPYVKSNDNTKIGRLVNIDIPDTRDVLLVYLFALFPFTCRRLTARYKDHIIRSTQIHIPVMAYEIMRTNRLNIANIDVRDAIHIAKKNPELKVAEWVYVVTKGYWDPSFSTKYYQEMLKGPIDIWPSVQEYFKMDKIVNVVDTLSLSDYNSINTLNAAIRKQYLMRLTESQQVRKNVACMLIIDARGEGVTLDSQVVFTMIGQIPNTQVLAFYTPTSLVYKSINEEKEAKGIVEVTIEKNTAQINTSYMPLNDVFERRNKSVQGYVLMFTFEDATLQKDLHARETDPDSSYSFSDGKVSANLSISSNALSKSDVTHVFNAGDRIDHEKHEETHARDSASAGGLLSATRKFFRFFFPATSKYTPRDLIVDKLWDTLDEDYLARKRNIHEKLNNTCKLFIQYNREIFRYEYNPEDKRSTLISNEYNYKFSYESSAGHLGAEHIDKNKKLNLLYDPQMVITIVPEDNAMSADPEYTIPIYDENGDTVEAEVSFSEKKMRRKSKAQHKQRNTPKGESNSR